MKLKLCTGTGIGHTFNCSEAEPYCASNESGDFCTKNNPCSSAGGADSTFQCTATGYFPNPKNCSSYFFCTLNADRTNYAVTEYICPSGNVFSPSVGKFFQDFLIKLIIN